MNIIAESDGEVLDESEDNVNRHDEFGALCEKILNW